MKKLLAIALASLTLVATPVFADTAIGVVNFTKILRDSKAATSVRTQMQAKQKSFQADLDAKEKSFQTEGEALEKQKDSADKAGFDKKRKDFGERVSAEQRVVQGKKAALEKSYAQAMEDIQKAFLDVTKQVATDKKLNLVVSSTQVAYADDALDITAEVLKRLDAKLPTVAVKF